MGTGQAHACTITCTNSASMAYANYSQSQQQKEKKGGKEEEQTCTTKMNFYRSIIRVSTKKAYANIFLIYLVY